MIFRRTQDVRKRCVKLKFLGKTPTRVTSFCYNFILKTNTFWNTGRHRHNILHCNGLNFTLETNLIHVAMLQESDHLKSIFSYLTGKQISKACHVAHQHGDYRLSLLLSQVTGNSVTRNLIYKQISEWQEMKVGLESGDVYQ